MKLAAIALRNLARNRRRTLISLLVTAAGACGLVVTAGFIRFSFGGLQQAIIRGGLGHLEVVPTELANLSLPERSGLPTLAGFAQLQRAIEKTPGVRAAGAAIHLAGVVSKGDRSAPFLGAAVEPDRERRMDLELKLRAGANLPAQAPSDGDDAVLLGLGLARALGAQPGDVVTILALTPSGNLNAVDMKVSGLFTTGLQEIDGRMLKLHLVSAQRLLETASASSIFVALDDTGQTEALRDRLQRELAPVGQPVTVLDWQTRAPFYGQVRALYSAIFVFLGTIIFVLVCLAASNSLLMSVMERIREIGTLLALGTSRAQVAVLILCEALWLGILGGSWARPSGSGSPRRSGSPTSRCRPRRAPWIRCSWSYPPPGGRPGHRGPDGRGAARGRDRSRAEGGSPAHRGGPRPCLRRRPPAGVGPLRRDPRVGSLRESCPLAVARRGAAPERRLDLGARLVSSEPDRHQPRQDPRLCGLALRRREAPRAVPEPGGQGEIPAAARRRSLLHGTPGQEADQA